MGSLHTSEWFNTAGRSVKDRPHRPRHRLPVPSGPGRRRSCSRAPTWRGRPVLARQRRHRPGPPHVWLAASSVQRRGRTCWAGCYLAGPRRARPRPPTHHADRRVRALQRVALATSPRPGGGRVDGISSTVRPPHLWLRAVGSVSRGIHTGGRRRAASCRRRTSTGRPPAAGSRSRRWRAWPWAAGTTASWRSGCRLVHAKASGGAWRSRSRSRCSAGGEVQFSTGYFTLWARRLRSHGARWGRRSSSCLPLVEIELGRHLQGVRGHVHQRRRIPAPGRGEPVPQARPSWWPCRRQRNDARTFSFGRIFLWLQVKFFFSLRLLCLNACTVYIQSFRHGSFTQI